MPLLSVIASGSIHTPFSLSPSATLQPLISPEFRVTDFETKELELWMSV